MVGWKLLQCTMNSFSSSSDPFQMKKMSSMNLLHMCTAAAPTQAASNPVSSQPMKMQANVGATLVPMAVP